MLAKRKEYGTCSCSKPEKNCCSVLSTLNCITGISLSPVLPTIPAMVMDDVCRNGECHLVNLPAGTIVIAVCRKEGHQ